MKRRSGSSAGTESILDAVVDVSLGELSGYADAIHNGALVGAAMADDAHTTHSQQRSSAVLGVVDALLEVVKRLAAQQRAHLRRDSGLETFAQEEVTIFARPSLVLSATLPTKPSHTTTSTLPL